MAQPKPNRKASEQFNIRMPPREAALIRAAFPRGDLTPVATQLLLDEARARLRLQPQLNVDEGRKPAA